MLTVSFQRLKRYVEMQPGIGINVLLKHTLKTTDPEHLNISNILPQNKACVFNFS